MVHKQQRTHGADSFLLCSASILEAMPAPTKSMLLKMTKIDKQTSNEGIGVVRVDDWFPLNVHGISMHKRVEAFFFSTGSIFRQLNIPSAVLPPVWQISSWKESNDLLCVGE